MTYMHKMDTRKPKDRQHCTQRPKSIRYEVLNVICSLLYHEAMTDSRNTSELLKEIETNLSKDERQVQTRIDQLKKQIAVLDEEVRNFKKSVAMGLDLEMVVPEIKERGAKIDDMRKAIEDNETILKTKRQKFERIAAEFTVGKLEEYRTAPGYLKRNMLQKILDTCTIRGNLVEAKLITGVGYMYNVESVKKAMERTGGRTGKPYDEAAIEVLTEMLADKIAAEYEEAGVEK